MCKYRFSQRNLFRKKQVSNTGNTRNDEADADPCSAGSWRYAYLPSGITGTSIINNKVFTGKILYLEDSYDQVVVPFLTLGVQGLNHMYSEG